MASKLTKKVVEAAQSEGRDKLVWDNELKGFGLRVFPSGVRKFILQYRLPSGQQRRMVLGTFPVLTAERARELALKHLATVGEGGDPAGDKRALRQAETLAELCDAYMEAMQSGLVLSRRGQPKRALTVYTDKGRIERHIKPVLGHLRAREVTRVDVERFKTAVVTGKTAADVKTKQRGRARVTGGRGAATRALGLLGSIFQWGISQGLVESNPVRGVRRFADAQRKALLTHEQYRALGRALDELGERKDRKGNPIHHKYGLACIRFIALTGLRRGEAEQLRWDEVDIAGCCIRLRTSKSETLRPLGAAARELLGGLERISGYVFPAGPELVGYKGLPRLLKHAKDAAAGRAILRRKPGRPSRKSPTPTDEQSVNHSAAGPLDDLTFHALRHSLAGTAEALQCSYVTIQTLLGHKLAGVTGGYILKRLDQPLISAADRVSERIEWMMSTEPADVVVAMRKQLQ